MILTLSELPPSSNVMYGNNTGKGKRGRFKTKEYKAWQNAAMWEIKAQQGPHQTIMVPVIATYMLKRPVNNDGCPTKRRIDAENYCKAISDTLSSARILEDDSLIWDLRRAWAMQDQTNAVVITIDLL